MITRHVDLGILSPHLVHFCCFASLITSIYIKNFTVLFVQKSFQTCDGASHVVTSNTLMMEQLSQVATVVTLYRVSYFKAAYGRVRSLTRDTTALASCAAAHRVQDCNPRPPVLVLYAPAYLADDCQLVADAHVRQLRFADT